MITIAINDHDINYIPVLTNAIQDYDYAYTIYLCKTHSLKFDKEARLILIPVEAEKYQRGRYESGLFFSERVDLSSHRAEHITQELWKRLHTPTNERNQHEDHKDQPHNWKTKYARD